MGILTNISSLTQKSLQRLVLWLLALFAILIITNLLIDVYEEIENRYHESIEKIEQRKIELLEIKIQRP